MLHSKSTNSWHSFFCENLQKKLPFSVENIFWRKNCKKTKLIDNKTSFNFLI